MVAKTTSSTSAGTQLWDLGSSWSPSGVPGAGDDVVIGAATVLLISNAQAKSLTLASPSSRFTVNPGSALSVNGVLAINAGTFALNGPLSNATLSVGDGTLIEQTDGWFNNVTIATPLDVAAVSSNPVYPEMWFQGALTLATPGQPALRLTAPNAWLTASTQFTFGLGIGAPASLDGGIVLMGSSDASRPAEIIAATSPLTLGAGLGLAVVGAADLAAGPAGSILAPIVNNGTIDVGPGGFLRVFGTVSGSGTMHVASGTLDLTGVVATTGLTTPIQMDDGGAKLVLNAGQSVTVGGFRAGDTIRVTGASFPVPTISKTATSVSIGSGTLTFTGAAAGATYTTAPDGSGGYLVTTNAVGAAAVGFVDQTTGASGSHWLDAAAGGPSYLKWQYIDAGPDTMAISSATPNVFLHGGTGEKAMAVTSGQNVLDGGTGSSFLTGGSGTDTFFVDARYGSPVWDTIRNFHAGDAVTVWGWVPGVNSMTVDANAGAAGSEGATVRILNGAGSTVASVTFSGMSADQVGHLQQATGTQGAGPYLYLFNPGV